MARRWFLAIAVPAVRGRRDGQRARRRSRRASAGEIGDLLAEQGRRRLGFFFSLRARLSGDRERLRAGTYTLQARHVLRRRARRALTTAPAADTVVNVTLPEGRVARARSIPRVRQAGLRGSYLEATRARARLRPRDYGAPTARARSRASSSRRPTSCEAGAPVARLVATQLEAFKDNFAELDLTPRRRRNLSRYDVLIIASMVEREALVAEGARA